MAQEEEISMRLYVGRLSYQTTSQDLTDLFGQVGQVQDAIIVTDRETQASRGFGFVDMPNEAEARHAIDRLNRTELSGQTIVVSEAHERTQQPRGYSNGFQSRGPRPDQRGGNRNFGRRY
jgi:RNA recognition motif-containing protein